MDDISLLGLGDILTLLGLFIAIFQLVRPIYKIIWKLTTRIFKVFIFFCFIVGYFTPFLALLVNNCCSNGCAEKLGVSSNNVIASIHVVGFVFITIGFILLAYIMLCRIHRRHLIRRIPNLSFEKVYFRFKTKTGFYYKINFHLIYSPRALENFYYVISRTLFEGESSCVIELVKNNLSGLVKNACQYSPYRKIEGNNSKCFWYAYEILSQFLTDDKIMKYICVNDLDFLSKIIHLEMKYYVGDSCGALCEFDNVLYCNVMQYLITIEKSYLYQQINYYRGFARDKNIYILITNERVISRTRIMPFLIASDVLQNIEAEKYMEVLCKLFMIILEQYKNNPTEPGYGNSKQLANLNDLLGAMIGTGLSDGLVGYLIANENYREEFFACTQNSTIEKVLSTLDFKVLNYLYVDRDPLKFQKCQFELETEESEYNNVSSFVEIMAYSVFCLLGYLASLQLMSNHDSEQFLTRIINDIIYVKAKYPLVYVYKRLLYEKMLKKAFTSFDSNIKGYYPVMTRIMIIYFAKLNGLHDEVDKTMHDKLIHYMKTSLAKAIMLNRKMANGRLMKKILLPNTVYTRKYFGKLHYYWNIKGKREKIV